MGTQTVALAIYQAVILREDIKHGIEGMKELMAYATTVAPEVDTPEHRPQKF
jgi:hypothetical protein